MRVRDAYHLYGKSFGIIPRLFLFYKTNKGERNENRIHQILRSLASIFRQIGVCSCINCGAGRDELIIGRRVSDDNAKQLLLACSKCGRTLTYDADDCASDISYKWRKYTAELQSRRLQELIRQLVDDGFATGGTFQLREYYNAADTWRDPDEIVEVTNKSFDSLTEAIQAAIPIVEKYYHPVRWSCNIDDSRRKAVLETLDCRSYGNVLQIKFPVYII